MKKNKNDENNNKVNISVKNNSCIKKSNAKKCFKRKNNDNCIKKIDFGENGNLINNQNINNIELKEITNIENNNNQKKDKKCCIF